mmetsp:Transcript_52226/g.111192  ORF Transcript_52226/g.111192 Transcript_52226/m.111192 type:complete len:256 (-) Transcript_52226:62-829(-)
MRLASRPRRVTGKAASATAAVALLPEIFHKSSMSSEHRVAATSRAHRQQTPQQITDDTGSKRSPACRARSITSSRTENENETRRRGPLFRPLWTGSHSSRWTATRTTLRSVGEPCGSRIIARGPHPPPPKLVAIGSNISSSNNEVRNINSINSITNLSSISKGKPTTGSPSPHQNTARAGVAVRVRATTQVAVRAKDRHRRLLLLVVGVATEARCALLGPPHLPPARLADASSISDLHSNSSNMLVLQQARAEAA